MRILLADDHGLFLEGLQNLLTAGGYLVVGAAYDGLEALEQARRLLPELILMDIRMPICDGLKATRLIKTELPEIQIVMLTTSAEEADLFEALKSGAVGYLLKNLKPNELFDYLAGLERSEAPLSPELAGRLIQAFSRQSTELDALRECQKASHSAPTTPTPMAGNSELTAQQHRILEMVANGLSYKEIGAALHVSENTVKYHMRAVLQRLHAKNREQVVAYALQTGLVRRSI